MCICLKDCLKSYFIFKMSALKSTPDNTRNIANPSTQSLADYYGNVAKDVFRTAKRENWTPDRVNHMLRNPKEFNKYLSKVISFLCSNLDSYSLNQGIVTTHLVTPRKIRYQKSSCANKKILRSAEDCERQLKLS